MVNEDVKGVITPASLTLDEILNRWAERDIKERAGQMFKILEEIGWTTSFLGNYVSANLLKTPIEKAKLPFKVKEELLNEIESKVVFKIDGLAGQFVHLFILAPNIARIIMDYPEEAKTIKEILEDLSKCKTI